MKPLFFCFLIYLQSLIVPDRLSLNLHFLEKLIVSLLERHHVGRISASGNSCSCQRSLCAGRLCCPRCGFSHQNPHPLHTVFFVASKCFGFVFCVCFLKMCLCVSFTQFNIKELYHWGFTESVHIVKLDKVNFQSDTWRLVFLSTHPLVLISSGAAHLEICPVQFLV